MDSANKLQLYVAICQPKTKNKNQYVFSSWEGLILGVPQGSLFELLVFNIYRNDLFLLKDVDLSIFPDDTTTYICDENLENILKLLEKNCA